MFKGEIEKFIENEFLARRIVELKGDVTAELVHRLERMLMVLQLKDPKAPIRFIINSGGGDGVSARQLCDVMASLTTPIIGIAIGLCGSAATFIYLHCDERIASRYARFLIHSGALGFEGFPLGSNTVKASKQLAIDTKKGVAEIEKMYARKLRIKRKMVRKIMDRGDQYFDETLYAEEAKDIGLVHRIYKKKKLPLFGD